MNRSNFRNKPESVSAAPIEPARPGSAIPAPPKRAVRPSTIPCGSTTLRFGRTPLVMGVLNVTTDSFSDGGMFADTDAAVSHALAMCDAGADIIDVGGESTRPGAERLSASAELDRVLPVLDTLREYRRLGKTGGVPVSIDTRNAEVAEAALKHGCEIINDVSAAGDPEMTGLLRHYKDVPIVLMHMKGAPETMQDSPYYADVTREVSAFLCERAESLVRAGIERNRIVIDPGIGFGKRFRDNLELLNRIDSLRSLGYPLLIGASRKRFLGELLDAAPAERLPGNLAVAARCCNLGVDIVRVHDVRETVGLFRVLDAMNRPEDYEADW